MSFLKWIRDTGPREVAKRLAISHTTVYGWLKGENAPSARLMHDVVDLANGEVTYKMIVDETVGRRPMKRQGAS